jgi:hypothetical protein
VGCVGCAQAEAEARADSYPASAEASAAALQEQAEEDLSHVPEEIVEEMGKLPAEGAAALLDAYKQRVALRRELESQVLQLRAKAGMGALDGSVLGLVDEMAADGHGMDGVGTLGTFRKTEGVDTRHQRSMRRWEQYNVQWCVR